MTQYYYFLARVYYSHSSKVASPHSLLSKRLEQGNITLELIVMGVDKTLKAVRRRIDWSRAHDEMRVYHGT